MRRNRRRVLSSIPSNLLPLWLWSLFLRFNPGLFSNVLPWTGGMRLFLDNFVLEPVNLWWKTVWRFNDSYSEFFQPKHWKILCWLHALPNLVKPNCWLICSWTYFRLMKWTSDYLGWIQSSAFTILMPRLFLFELKMVDNYRNVSLFVWSVESAYTAGFGLYSLWPT